MAFGDGLPAECEIRNWTVFRNGAHRPGAYFSPAQVAQIAANHRTCREKKWHLPVMKFSHDSQRRVALNLGMPNIGQLPEPGDVADDGRGNLTLTVRRVPTWLGGLINAGRYTAGSVELKRLPDPDNPAADLPDDCLLAVGLLGEEEPQVKGCDPPRAYFADGAEVPPNFEPLAVPAEALQSTEADRLRLAALHPTLCFTAGAPTVTPEDMRQKLATEFGLPPEAIPADPAALQALYQSLTCDAFTGHMKAKYAAPQTPPAAPPGQNVDMMSAITALSASFKAFTDKAEQDKKEFSDRLAATERAFTDAQTQMSAEVAKFTAEAGRGAAAADKAKRAAVTGWVDQAFREGRVLPVDRQLHIDNLMSLSDAKEFSDGPHKGLTELEVGRRALFARPANQFTAAAVPDPVDRDGSAVPTGAQMLIARVLRPNGLVAKHSPALHERLTAASAN